MSDRKYRQRGYRDDDSPSPRERAAPQPRSERGERPRGRGLGAPTEEVFRCARCGAESAVGQVAGFDARCASCGNDLHTCSNCVAFDSGARFECRREIPARVSPKDRGNRCELFEPRLRQEFAREKAKPGDAGDARAAFDALFKR